MTRAEIEKLMRDAGHATNANAGRCGLVEDVLCRVTCLCVDLLRETTPRCDACGWPLKADGCCSRSGCCNSD